MGWTMDCGAPGTGYAAISPPYRKRRVIILGPKRAEIPLLRESYLLPVDRPARFTEVPRSGYRAAFVSGALRGSRKVETYLDLGIAV